MFWDFLRTNSIKLHFQIINFKCWWSLLCNSPIIISLNTIRWWIFKPFSEYVFQDFSFLMISIKRGIKYFPIQVKCFWDFLRTNSIQLHCQISNFKCWWWSKNSWKHTDMLKNLLRKRLFLNFGLFKTPTVLSKKGRKNCPIKLKFVLGHLDGLYYATVQSSYLLTQLDGGFLSLFQSMFFKILAFLWSPSKEGLNIFQFKSNVFETSSGPILSSCTVKSQILSVGGGQKIVENIQICWKTYCEKDYFWISVFLRHLRSSWKRGEKIVKLNWNLFWDTLVVSILQKSNHHIS